jgi:hypothetical protein
MKAAAALSAPQLGQLLAKDAIAGKMTVAVLAGTDVAASVAQACRPNMPSCPGTPNSPRQALDHHSYVL